MQGMKTFKKITINPEGQKSINKTYFHADDKRFRLSSAPGEIIKKNHLEHQATCLN